MAKIISVTRAASVSKSLKRQHKKVVLAGGCFDVLHPGHVIFLEKAKKAGDCLVVLLESDQKVKELKGANRPVYTQRDRARVLSSLRDADYIVMLPYMKSGAAYDRLIQQIRPDIIAATAGSGNILHYKRTAKLIAARLKYVTGMIGNHSTSRILSHSIRTNISRP